MEKEYGRPALHSLREQLVVQEVPADVEPQLPPELPYRRPHLVPDPAPKQVREEQVLQHLVEPLLP